MLSAGHEDYFGQGVATVKQNAIAWTPGLGEIYHDVMEGDKRHPEDMSCEDSVGEGELQFIGTNSLAAMAQFLLFQKYWIMEGLPPEDEDGKRVLPSEALFDSRKLAMKFTAVKR